ncbi:MAG: hypothetical protein ACI9MC_002490 [Kiritimatiellia bacterium]
MSGWGGWVRYTWLHSNKGQPETAMSVAMFKPDEPSTRIAVKEAFPLSAARLGDGLFRFDVGESGLTSRRVWGNVGGECRVRWDFDVDRSCGLMRHLPGVLAGGPFPETQIVAPWLSCCLTGTLWLDGRAIEVAGSRLTKGTFGAQAGELVGLDVGSVVRRLKMTPTPRLRASPSLFSLFWA